MSDIDDILLNSVGKGEHNGEVVDITKEASKTKRKKQKPSVDTTKLAEWDEVIDNRPQKKQNIKKWTGPDFRIYINEKFVEQYGVTKTFPHAFFNTNFKRIRTSVSQEMGVSECDSPTMKEYVDFYFTRFIDEHMKKYKAWRLEMLGYDTCIRTFLRSRNERPVVAPAPEIPTVETPVILTKEIVSDAASLGHQALLMEFGIVIAVNYIATVESAYDDMAETEVHEVAVNALRRNPKVWVNIKEATEKYGPYPKWVMWFNLKDFIARVQQELGFKLTPIAVTTCDSDPAFGFMKHAPGIHPDPDR